MRHYALAAAAQASPASVSDVQVLNNKVTVAAIENNSPIAQVAIVIRYILFLQFDCIFVRRHSSI